MIEPFSLTIHTKTLLLNQLLKIHWSKKPKLRREIAWQIRAAMTPAIKSQEPVSEFKLHVDRYAYHTVKQKPDQDGLIGGLKPYIDTLCEQCARNPYGLGIVVDDSAKHMVGLTATAHLVGKRDFERTVFTISPVN